MFGPNLKIFKRKRLIKNFTLDLKADFKRQILQNNNLLAVEISISKKLESEIVKPNIKNICKNKK
jgi:hypothetical protein